LYNSSRCQSPITTQVAEPEKWYIYSNSKEGYNSSGEGSVRVALVEDDPHLGQLMVSWLAERKYVCQLFESGSDFKRGMLRDSFDVVILDWMLPGTTGDQLLLWLREQGHTSLPVIFVTARDTEEDIVAGLTLGADDYITKPLRQHEFLARVQSAYRRINRSANEQGVLEYPPYRISLQRHGIDVNGVSVELTEKEFEVALLLFRNVGKVISRAHIMESVWGQSADLNTRTVDTHMSRLRAKLNFQLSMGWKLSAVYNHGYRLENVDSQHQD